MLTISPRSDSQPLTLNKNFTINSKKEAIKNEAMHALLKTASVVAYVATIAIAAAVLTFSFLATGGTTMPLFMIGIALLSIPLCWGAAKLWQMSVPYKMKAQVERGVIASEKELRLVLANADVTQENAAMPWIKVKVFVDGKLVEKLAPPDYRIPTNDELDCEEILNKLRGFRIAHDSETLQEIARQLPRKKGEAVATEEDAIKSFVPVLSRLKFWIDNFHNQCAHSESLHETETTSADIRLEHDRQAYDLFERSVLSSALRAVHIFHVMHQPFTQTTKLEDIGAFCIKPLDQRLWDSKYKRPNDYFIFHDKSILPIPFDPVDKAVDDLAKTHDAIIKANKQNILPESENLRAELNPVDMESLMRTETAQLQTLREYLFEPILRPVIKA